MHQKRRDGWQSPAQGRIGQMLPTTLRRHEMSATFGQPFPLPSPIHHPTHMTTSQHLSYKQPSQSCILSLPLPPYHKFPITALLSLSLSFCVCLFHHACILTSLLQTTTPRHNHCEATLAKIPVSTCTPQVAHPDTPILTPISLIRRANSERKVKPIGTTTLHFTSSLHWLYDLAFVRWLKAISRTCVVGHRSPTCWW